MRKDLFSEHLEWAEGRRRKPYIDTVGKLSIGVGRNLDDKGLTDEEIDFLKARDMDDAIKGAEQFPYFAALNEVRQVVIADLVFNLGYDGFANFAKTNAALEQHDYETASDELLDSLYAKQTGRRAKRNAARLRTGQW